MISYLRMFWRNIFNREEVNNDLDDEVQSYLELKVDENIRRGMSPEDALREARRDLGGTEQVKQRVRDVRTGVSIDTAVQDLRHVIRALAKSPAFTSVMVLTLALGIGATTAIFTLVHAVLLWSLPVKNPSGLWRVGDIEQCCVLGGLPDNNDWSIFSFEQYEELRAHTPGFASLAAFEADTQQMAVRPAASKRLAEPYFAEFVSGNSFDTLGVASYRGRLFGPSDDVKGAAPVAMMSFQTWDRAFGEDPAIIGSTFLINSQPVTIVGIAPPGFYGERLSVNPPSFWIPLSQSQLLMPESDLLNHPELQWLNLIGRIEPGTTVANVEAQLQVELIQFLESPMSRIAGPDRLLIPRQYLRLSPGGAGVQRMQKSYSANLHLLMYIASFVLLIVCANLANLMLARSVTNQQPVFVRMALGASRSRVVQGALTECIVLALFGGLAGLFVAWGCVKLILQLAFHNNPVTISATASLAVLGFAISVSLLTGLLFGVAPAWLAAHANPIDALRGAHRSTDRNTRRTQQVLVVAQIAVSAVLLCAAGLLVLSLKNLQNQHFGFQTNNRAILEIDPQSAGYKPEQLDNFYRQLHDTLAAIPGVSNVAWSLWSPMDGEFRGSVVYVKGWPSLQAGGRENLAFWDRVSPTYFEAVGTTIVEGRNFLNSDNRNGRSVTIVNQAFVHDLLHGKDPIGMQIGDVNEPEAGTYEIVGVVENTQYWGPSEPIHPMYFLPAAQWPQIPPSDPRVAGNVRFNNHSHYMGSIEIETHGTVPQLEDAVKRAVAEVNPNLMMIRFQSFAEQVDLSFSQQKMIAKLTSLFGLLALLLAAIGLYGITAYGVARRTREIGIRMALGANRLDVMKMMLREALLQTGMGLIIGLPIAITIGHMMASQLFGIPAYDPFLLGITIMLLMVASLLAAALPARRAASVEPMEALRGE